MKPADIELKKDVNNEKTSKQDSGKNVLDPGAQKMSINDIQDLKNMMNFMQNNDGMNSNFHNFFTNDRIFGSPSPPVDQNMFPGQSNIKVENHYNQHTTINNYNNNAQKFYNI